MADNIQLVANSLEAQIEKVRTKVQDIFETSDNISGLLKKAGGEVETISKKLYRVPIRQWRGGSYQKINLDAGDMGSGSGMKINSLQAGYVPTDYVVEISLESLETTNKPGQAVMNVFARHLAEAMDEVKAYDDIAFHGDGSSKLTNSSSLYSSAGGGTGLDQYTFASSTDYLGINNLREGMTVSVWDSAGTTKRTTSVAPLVIIAIDYTNKVVTLNGTVTSGTTGDILTFANLSADTAAQSFQSTWPLSGDTFRHGLRYANDATSSNYYLGKQKSSIPQLLPTNVNAGASLTFAHGLLGIDGINQRRDKTVVKGLVGVAHMSQRAAVHALSMSINNIMLPGGKSVRSTDLMPENIGYEDTFDFCGIESHVSKRQDRSRYDTFVPKNWGRAQLHDTKFHEVGGKTVFESRTSTGSLKSAVHFIVVQTYDFVCYDPGAAFYISNLTLPNGY